jgi:DNA-directed RNA polymerase subunit RPC12/RpoP
VTVAGYRLEQDDRFMKPELRSELLRRAEKDQAARSEPEPDDETLTSVDGENLAWLRDLIAEVGWPGRSMAGEDGAHAAWLLAQHADQDPAFQRRCLDLMTEAVKRGEATLSELAYLTDRVLLAEGKPQEYGTQMTGRKEGWFPRNLRDPETVDERRAAMSLGPLRENIARIASRYGPPKPATFKCGQCGSGIEVWLPDEGETPDIRCTSCGWANMVLDREPLVVRPDRSRPPADVILDPAAGQRFASTWDRSPPDLNEIPVLLAEAGSGDRKHVEIYIGQHCLGTLTTAGSADFLALLATAGTDGKPVVGTAIRDRDAGGRWALRVYRPEPS